MPKVRAVQSVVISPAGGMPIGVQEGQAFDVNDPIVTEFRWLFEEPVEQATASPGERRNVRRPAQ